MPTWPLPRICTGFPVAASGRESGPASCSGFWEGDAPPCSERLRGATYRSPRQRPPTIWAWRAGCTSAPFPSLRAFAKPRWLKKSGSPSSGTDADPEGRTERKEGAAHRGEPDGCVAQCEHPRRIRCAPRTADKERPRIFTGSRRPALSWSPGDGAALERPQRIVCRVLVEFGKRWIVEHRVDKQV